MTKIYVNTIKPQTTGGNVSFLDPISANGKSQWVDTYGIIKTNSNTINDTVTIPSGTNGLSAGPIQLVLEVKSLYKESGVFLND